tara:strand:+ start:183 stop:929 length:747 start_codon:yes stop_codon:yes gene_type:complete
MEGLVASGGVYIIKRVAGLALITNASSVAPFFSGVEGKMIFRVQPGGKLQAFAHDERPLGGQTAFHYLMFRATVSTPDGKNVFTKIPPSASGDTKKSEIRLLHMRQLMAWAAKEGTDYCFRLAIPRAAKAATVLVPCAFSSGTHAKATHVRAPDGTVLPFASVRDARAAWHHMAVHCASSSPPKAATSKKKKEASSAPPPSPPITIFDPLPEVLPALPLACPPPPPPEEEEEEERVLRSRVIKRPRLV